MADLDKGLHIFSRFASRPSHSLVLSAGLDAIERVLKRARKVGMKEFGQG